MNLELKVSGMTCFECARRVRNALQRVDGVTSARVDHASGRGIVELEKAVPIETLLAAVKGAGYRAESGSIGSVAINGRSIASEARPVVRDIPASRIASDSAGSGVELDVLIIGSGGAGVAAAIQAAGMGANVGIAEANTLGGTCVNVGCIPSKYLIEAAAHYHTARRGFPGIAPCEPVLDWPAVIGGKNALVEHLRQAKYADVLASYQGIRILRGRAELLGGGRIRVGDSEHRARKVIIATGTTPALPPLKGLLDVNPLTSTTAMEVETLPRSMIVLGGSAVGLELGQVFSRFGVRVSVVELMPRILPAEDESISEALQRILVAEGMEIHTGVTATAAEREGADVILHVSQGGLGGELRAERLLVATGRRADTSGMGLQAVRVDVTAHGHIKVDATMRTSNPDVYAAGDVTGGPGYVYVAAAGGRVAAENAVRSLGPSGSGVGDLRELDLSTVPNVTFTAPQVASIGLTEVQAREAGMHVQVSTLALEHVPRAIVSHQAEGFIKIVADAPTGRLLGVHAVASYAGELMGEAALGMRFQLTTRDLTGTLHPYLTWSEGLKLAAQGFAQDVTRLSCCA